MTACSMPQVPTSMQRHTQVFDARTMDEQIPLARATCTEAPLSRSRRWTGHCLPPPLPNRAMRRQWLHICPELGVCCCWSPLITNTHQQIALCTMRGTSAVVLLVALAAAAACVSADDRVLRQQHEQELLLAKVRDGEHGGPCDAVTPRPAAAPTHHQAVLFAQELFWVMGPNHTCRPTRSRALRAGWPSTTRATRTTCRWAMIPAPAEAGGGGPLHGQALVPLPWKVVGLCRAAAGRRRLWHAAKRPACPA